MRRTANEHIPELSTLASKRTHLCYNTHRTDIIDCVQVTTLLTSRMKCYFKHYPVVVSDFFEG
jgi:hypothetical protein